MQMKMIKIGYHRYAIKVPIEMDATLARSTTDILKMMKYIESFVGDEMY